MAAGVVLPGDRSLAPRGRWIQEHFVLFGAQETNSYVGPCNRLAFNVGLHNENNDFTGVPWHRLPELRRRASEFYADQPVVRSYLALCWRFVMADA